MRFAKGAWADDVANKGVINLSDWIFSSGVAAARDLLSLSLQTWTR